MVYVFLADGVAEMEAVIIVEVLRRTGIETRTVGVTGGTVAGARGMILTADCSLDEMNETEMLVLPGGLLGVANLAASETVCRLVRDAVENNKPLGAICAAPGLLANLGLLKGRTVTCHPSVAERVKEDGALVTGGEWNRDNKLVTGRGPGATIAFSLALAALLRGDEAADALAGQLMVTWRN